jgi:sulfide:quinone oxidoreductase
VTAKPRVVILGAGFAGLETAYMLRMKLDDAVDLTVVCDRDTFLFKPNTIYIPFGADEQSLLIPLDKPLHKRHIAFHQARVEAVDVDPQRVSLEDGTILPYDFLVVGTGATMRPDEVPGLGEHASTIWTPAEMRSLGGRLEAMRRRALGGEHLDVLFLVPPNNKCSGPLYEIVFMLETWLRRQGIRDQISLTYSTYEKSFIHAFGPRLHTVVIEEFRDRGIDGHTEDVVTRVLEGEVIYQEGATRHFDELVSFPPYAAAVGYEGLPADDRGFLACDLATRGVEGHENVYAPGDAGDFPVKQAFLAFLEADAVAGHIASRVGGGGFATSFDPVSMCVMEMLDKATFAQVPLQLTGDASDPVEVRADADGDYKVGVSPLWRLGKKMLAVYLPMRFRAGEPFHAGNAWQLMDVGLKGMSAMLAD